MSADDKISWCPKCEGLSDLIYHIWPTFSCHDSVWQILGLLARLVGNFYKEWVNVLYIRFEFISVPIDLLSVSVMFRIGPVLGELWEFEHAHHKPVKGMHRICNSFSVMVSNLVQYCFGKFTGLFETNRQLCLLPSLSHWESMPVAQ